MYRIWHAKKIAEQKKLNLMAFKIQSAWKYRKVKQLFLNKIKLSWYAKKYSSCYFLVSSSISISINPDYLFMYFSASYNREKKYSQQFKRHGYYYIPTGKVLNYHNKVSIESIITQSRYNQFIVTNN